jgi:hypothetical protein
MNVNDARDLLILIGLSAVPAAAMGSWLFWPKPAWSGRRLRLFAASPFPLLVAALCLWLFIDASFLSSEAECGVDACGMAAMFSVIGLVYATIAFVISYGVAWLFTRSRP